MLCAAPLLPELQVFGENGTFHYPRVFLAGDKLGNIGLWNVDTRRDDDDLDIVQFRPHSWTINALQFHPNDNTKLYSVSYDGTARCMDIERGHFDFVASVEKDTRLQHGTLDPNGNLLYLSDTEGTVRCFDVRSKQLTWSSVLHDNKINTVDCHPNEPHYFVTASLDRSVKIWDARNIKKNKPQTVVVCTDGRSVNSAKFSPCGSQILTVSMMHQLNLYVDAHKRAAEKIIRKPDIHCRHDNQTGRCVTQHRLTMI